MNTLHTVGSEQLAPIHTLELADVQTLRLVTHSEPRVRTVPSLTLKPEVALFAGTEWKGFQRGHPKLYPKYPSAFGHQVVGHIASVPHARFEAWLGQRVVVANSMACGHCQACTHEAWNVCESLHLFSGAFSTLYSLPSELLTHPQHTQGKAFLGVVALPETLSSHLAVYAQLLAVCLRGLKRLPPLPHAPQAPQEVVVVIGLGPVGLTLAKLYQQSGAKVIGIARSAMTLAKAQTLGFFHALMTPEVFQQDYVQAQKPYHTLVEATGRLEVWQQCLQWVRPQGRILFFGGVPRDTTLTVDTYALHYQELTLVGSFHYTWQDLHEAIEHLHAESASWERLWGIQDAPKKTLQELAQVLSDETPALLGLHPLPWHILCAESL
ncbi:MAG: zinc-binding dehydrogenase [Vampirovibrionales bacterium]